MFITFSITKLKCKARKAVEQNYKGVKSKVYYFCKRNMCAEKVRE